MGTDCPAGRAIDCPPDHVNLKDTKVEGLTEIADSLDLFFRVVRD